jgi:hypothetical protein
MPGAAALPRGDLNEGMGMNSYSLFKQYDDYGRQTVTASLLHP